MEYAIGVLLDKNTTIKLNDIIMSIASGGANFYMVDTKIPPHITLAYFRTDNINAIISVINEHSSSWHTGDIFFSSLGVFVPDILFVAPTFSEYLRNLNLKINDLIKNMCVSGDEGHYLPNQWVPHITLASKLDNADLKASLEAATNIFTAFKGCSERLFLAECYPYKEIATWKLVCTV